MTTQGLVLVCVSALLTVAANLLLRNGLLEAGPFGVAIGGVTAAAARIIRQPTFLLGVLFYGAAALVWFAVVSRESLSISYPLLVSLTFVLVTAGAMIFFNEQVNAQRITGIAIILAGVVVVARS